MGRLTSAVLPARLGRDFRWLWTGAVSSNLADGLLLTAGPLLVASVTRSPAAIASAVFVQRVPWVLFGVVAGAIIDRVDRRRLIVAVNILRAGVLGLLAVAVFAGWLNLWVIYIVFFLLGTAEAFGDNAGSTMVAVVTPHEAMGLANARMISAHMLANQLVGPPLGAFVFGLAVSSPFALAGAGYVLAAALVARIRLDADDTGADERAGLRHEVTEGMRWLRGHRPVRMLAILITVFNITYGAAFSVWVLYALEVLGLSEFGFGLLMTGLAVGGLAGSLAFEQLERRFSYASMLRVGLVIEMGTHLIFASTRSVALAAITLTVFGAHAVTWGTLSNTIRHRAVPRELLGRVTSVYMIGAVGAMALGALLGGLIAETFGLLATFWFAGAGAGLTTIIVWRSIADVAAAGEIGAEV